MHLLERWANCEIMMDLQGEGEVKRCLGRRKDGLVMVGYKKWGQHIVTESSLNAHLATFSFTSTLRTHTTDVHTPNTTLATYLVIMGDMLDVSVPIERDMF